MRKQTIKLANKFIRKLAHSSEVDKLKKMAMSAPSVPSDSEEDPIRMGMHEVLSGISALNMDPDPIEGATGFLSKTDNMAAHAVKHLTSAFDWLNLASSKKEEAKERSRSKARKIIEELSARFPEFKDGHDDIKDRILYIAY